jgi:hypothetical protein
MNTQQKFWRKVTSAGRCTSKAQSVITRMFLNQQRDKSIPMNARDVPLGRSFELIAELANQMGLRTTEGKAWKRTRVQQVIFNGLARKMVSVVRPKLEVGSFEHNQAVNDCEATIWRVMNVRVRHGRRWQHKPPEERHTAVRILPDGSQMVFEHRPRSERYWSKLRFRAKANGRYRHTDRFWWLD